MGNTGGQLGTSETQNQVSMILVTTLTLFILPCPSPWPCPWPCYSPAPLECTLVVLTCAMGPGPFGSAAGPAPYPALLFC